MRILTRYIFREFVVPLGYCLVGFVSIYVLFELFGSFSRIVSAKIPLSVTAKYLAAYLSPFFHYVAPASLMLATLYTMWNFCRHSEITAMRASGISLATVVKPLLVAACAMAAFVAWVNESYMPRHAQWAMDLRKDRFGKDGDGRPDTFTYCNTSGGRRWMVAGGHDSTYSRLADVRVGVDAGEGVAGMTVTAPKAEYLDGEWWFHEPKIQRYGADGRPKATPTPELDALPLRSFPSFTERPEDMRMQDTDARFGSVRGKLRYLATSVDMSADGRRDILYDAWAQAVSPLACIVITLLTIPAGITSGRQAVSAGVLGALGMFFAYYGFVIGCMVLVKTGYMPPVAAALLPPVLFGVLGAFHCVRSLAPTLWLLAAFAVLTGVYVVLSRVLTAELGVDAAMAHSLAATLPVAAAAICVFKFKER